MKRGAWIIRDTRTGVVVSESIPSTRKAIGRLLALWWSNRKEQSK